MLPAELAVLVDLKSVRIILLVFLCVVVSLFAFAACECDSDAHYRHLLKLIEAKMLLFEVTNRSKSQLIYKSIQVKLFRA